MGMNRERQKYNFDKYEFKRNELAIELASENTKANKKLMKQIYKRRIQQITQKNK